MQEAAATPECTSPPTPSGGSESTGSCKSTGSNGAQPSSLIGTGDEPKAAAFLCLPKEWKDSLWLVLGVLLIAFCLRLTCAMRAPLVGADSPRFLRTAQLFEEGDQLRAMMQPYHPLTSYLIACTHSAYIAVLGPPSTDQEAQASRERAALILNIALGCLLVLLLMEFSRQYFPQLPFVAVGLLTAFQPYLVRSSADIMSDTLFLVLFFAALIKAHHLVMSGRLLSAWTAGALAGICFLSRPEAMLLPLAFLGSWFCLSVKRQKLKQFASASLTMLSAFCLMAIPYIATISIVSGRLTLTLKRNLDDFLGLAFINGGGLHGEFLASTSLSVGSNVLLAKAIENSAPFAFLDILDKWATTGPEVITFFAIIGVLCGFKKILRLNSFSTLFFVYLGILSILLLLTHSSEEGYLSRRHCFTLVCLGIPFSIMGVMACKAGLQKKWPQKNWKHAHTCLFVFISAAMMPKAIASQRVSQLSQLYAANVIREEFSDYPIVFTLREKVPYYAGKKWHSIGYEPKDLMRELVKRPKAMIAFYQQRVGRQCPGLAEKAVEWSQDATSGIEFVGSYYPDGSSFDGPLKGPSSRRKLVLYSWDRSKSKSE